MKKAIGLYWFTQDLRIQDNVLLRKAASEVDKLICLYCMPPFSEFLHQYAQENQFGEKRSLFLQQSLQSLHSSLRTFNQTLVITALKPYSVIHSLMKVHHVTHLYSDAFAGSDEQQVFDRIRQDFPERKFTQISVRSVFQQKDLPFQLGQLPQTFTQFRKKIEALSKPKPSRELLTLPRAIDVQIEQWPLTGQHNETALFAGGEQAAIEHCRRYFESTLASRYKETRNGLDGMDYSTKFSPWLALGCLSPKTILEYLAGFECTHGANDSTYWIYFELLWREYFYWLARKRKVALFHFSSLQSSSPLARFCPKRFLDWKQGKTSFPIVNACMHQLLETGYMSNRGRQLVASCLIHELQLDWRYGAAYFETQLVDYDVASNWGNWQYLAGVDGDPRGSRRFNLEKQTEFYDPHRVFIDRWQGDYTKNEHC